MDRPLHLMIPPHNHRSSHSTTPTSASSTELSHEMSPSHHPPLDYVAMTGVVANPTTDYNTNHISSSDHPASAQDEGHAFGNGMIGYNTNQQSVPTSMIDQSWSTSMYGDGFRSGGVDIDRWMRIDEFAPPTANEHVSFRTPKATAQVKAQDILDRLGPVLPETSAPTANKRRRMKTTSHSIKDEEDDEAEPRRKKGIAPVAQPPHPQPQYARLIAQEIRELLDEDFEASCEWCPFYLHEPLKHFPKPWTSCTKQRAEISHIITHIVSDHGLIRGNNSKRKNQRYLTRCSSHKPEKKGKSDCVTCSKVEDWTERELRDERHEGPAVCLRCYTELGDKRALLNHLHTPSICMYKEDLLMKAKSKILYKVFCAENEVPKFRPPPETSAPRDGARKRNMKTSRRTTSEPSAAQNNSRTVPRAHRELRQSQSPLPPSLILTPSPRQDSIPEFGDDGSVPMFSPIEATKPHLTQSHQHAQLSQFMPPPRVPSFIPRQPMPSRTSDYDQTLDLELGPTYPGYRVPHIRTSHCENPPPVQVMAMGSMGSQFLQLPGAQMGGEKYPSAYDSGLGSEGIHSQNAYDDPYQLTFNTNDNITNNMTNHMTNNMAPNFFDDAWAQDVYWPS